MEAIADQQTKHWGSTDVLTRAGSRGGAEPHGAFDGGARVSRPTRRLFLGTGSVPTLIVVPLWKSVPMEALRVQRAGHGGHAGVRNRADSPVGGASKSLTFDGGALPAAARFFASRRLVLRPGNAAGLNCRTPLKECSYGSS